MNWELLEDKQRKVFTIPVGDLSANEVRELLARLLKSFPNLVLERKLKVDKIMGRINEEKRPI